jgi:hypothetical protein
MQTWIFSFVNVDLEGNENRVLLTQISKLSHEWIGNEHFENSILWFSKNPMDRPSRVQVLQLRSSKLRFPFSEWTLFGPIENRTLIWLVMRPWKVGNFHVQKIRALMHARAPDYLQNANSEYTEYQVLVPGTLHKPSTSTSTTTVVALCRFGICTTYNTKGRFCILQIFFGITLCK